MAAVAAAHHSGIALLDAATSLDHSLPEGWAEAVDPASGHTYYYNSSTGETQWERPPAPPIRNPRPPVPAGRSALEQIKSIKMYAHDTETRHHAALESAHKAYEVMTNETGGSTIIKALPAGMWRNHYENSTLPDDDQWLDVLRQLRENGQLFNDPDFPPDESSIWRNPAEKSSSENFHSLSHAVKWCRIKDIFHSDFYVKVSIPDNNEAPKIGGLTSVEESEFNEKSQEARTSENGGEFLEKINFAKAAITSAFTEASRPQFFASCSDYIREWLEGQYDAERTNFDVFFGQLEQLAAPSPFRSCGDESFAIREVKDPKYVPNIHVYVKIIFKPEHFHLFERSKPGRPLVAPGDVRQGELGDCYFLGALSVMSAHEGLLFDLFPDLTPDLVLSEWVPPGSPENEQQANPEGLYAVRFWREGRWRIVIIDDYLPCNEAGRPCFAQPASDSCEIWAMLAEKAYAKLNGSYEAIISGQENEALADLTAGLPFDYILQGANADPNWAGADGRDKLWHHLSSCNDPAKGEMDLLCASTRVAANGIMSGHAYGLISLQEIVLGGQRERIVNVRNPWGSGKEWSGKWSDHDPAWSSIPQETKDMLGFKDEEDGSWFMSWSDFCDNFHVINMCRLLRPPRWMHHIAAGEWFGEGAGGQLSIKSPQYHLAVYETTKIHVNVGQNSARLGTGEYDHGIGISVEMPAEEGSKTWKKRRLELGKRIDNATRIERDRECSVELILEASSEPYLIRPITTKPGQEGPYFLSVFSDKPTRLAHVADGTNGYKNECSKRVSATGDRAGGCYPNNMSWIKNPQVLLCCKEGSNSGKILIMVEQEDSPEGDDLKPIGFLVAKCESGHTLKVINQDDVIVSSQIVNSKCVTASFVGNPGQSYCIVPFAFQPGVDVDFDVRALSDTCTLTLEAMRPWDSELSLSGAWTEGLAGGCCNSPETWLQNPSMRFSVQSTGKVTIMILQVGGGQRLPVGFVLFRAESQNDPHGEAWYQNAFAGELEQGEYRLVAQTFNAGQLGEFEIVLQSDEVQLEASYDEDALKGMTWSAMDI
eukprot:g4148.t1